MLLYAPRRHDGDHTDFVDLEGVGVWHDVRQENERTRASLVGLLADEEKVAVFNTYGVEFAPPPQ